MPKFDDGNLVPASGGFVSALILRAKLIWRLMSDKRVSTILKAIPVFSLIYLINPIDIPTPLDDAAVVGLGMTMFVSLCPEQVVAEHMAALQAANPVIKRPSSDDDIVDVPYRTIDENDSYTQR